MHPDRKVGFATGILLVGVVAALFFRNEPLLIDEMPTVARERELNERLRERDVPVYLDDDPAVTQDSQTPAGADAQHPWTLREFFDELEDRNSTVPVPVGHRPEATETARDTAAVPSRSASRFTPPPVDERVTDDSSSDPAVPRSEFNKLVEAASGEPSTAEPGSAEVPRQGSYDEYTVQYGDTLSGIADRFLGSSQKYQELYDANRDRLSSPDRLRVGKAIRIPRQVH